jgi:hypothetical protein
MQFKIKLIFQRWLMDEDDNIIETYFPDVSSVNQAAVWIGSNYASAVLYAKIYPDMNQCINIDLFTTQYSEAVAIVQAFKSQFGDGIETYWIEMRQ